MRIQDRIKGLALQGTDGKHSSGVGEIWLRQTMTYLAALIWNVDFYLKYVPLYELSETNTPSELNVNNDLLKIFNFLAQNQLNYQQEITNIDQYIHDPNLYTRSGVALLPWHNALEIFDTQTNDQKRELIKRIRKEFVKYCTYKPKADLFDEGAFNIALHLRNVVPRFERSHLLPQTDGLTFQYFSIDYGRPDNNPIFYARFYAAIIDQYVTLNPQKKINIVVYSTGDEKDFSYLLDLLSKHQTKLVINGYTADDFYHLCFFLSLCYFLLFNC